MKCPLCPDQLLVPTERMGIEIDYCPQCRGVWLDRGELDRFVGGADTPVSAATAPRDVVDRGGERADDRGNDPGKRRKRRLSDLFEEILDLG